jgi:hypothetical protein
MPAEDDWNPKDCKRNEECWCQSCRALVDKEKKDKDKGEHV